MISVAPVSKAMQVLDGWMESDENSVLQILVDWETYSSILRFITSGVLVELLSLCNYSYTMNAPSLCKTSKLLKLSKKTS